MISERLPIKTLSSSSNNCTHVTSEAFFDKRRSMLCRGSSFFLENCSRISDICSVKARRNKSNFTKKKLQRKTKNYQPSFSSFGFTSCSFIYYFLSECVYYLLIYIYHCLKQLLTRKVFYDVQTIRICV